MEHSSIPSPPHSSRPDADAAPPSVPPWTPSKAKALDPTSLSVPRTRRGWERAPKTPLAQHSRVKKVWRRYELRPQSTAADKQRQEDGVPSNEHSRSPAHIVKKIRVKSPFKKSEDTPFEGENTRLQSYHAATRWDRRRSGLRRKPPASFQDEPTGPASGAERENLLGHSSSAVTPSELTDEVQQPRFALRDVDKPTPDMVEHGESQEDVSEAQLAGSQTALPLLVDIETSKPLTFEEASPLESADQTTEPAPMDQCGHFSHDVPNTVHDDVVVYPELTIQSNSAPTSPVKSVIIAQIEPREVAESVVLLSDLQMRTGFACTTTPTAEGYGEDEEHTLPNCSLETNKALPNEYAFAAVEEVTPVEAVFLPPDTSEKSTMLETSQNTMLGTLQDSYVQDCQSPAQPSVGCDSISPIFDIKFQPHEYEAPGVLARSDKSATATTDTLALLGAQLGEDASTEDDESPCSSPDELSLDLDATETLTLTTPGATTHLEDDRAILRSFLNRAAASKANKVASYARRESLQNRRDSDVVRKALASPRHVLEEKDANLSPQRILGAADTTASQDQVVASPRMNFKRIVKDTVQDAPPNFGTAQEKDELADQEAQSGSPRRRSQRTRTRIPQLPTVNIPQVGVGTPNKIPVRTDGGERVILNRTEAQQLADIVRKNTRKNKGGAIPAPQRLARLKADALAAITDGSPSPTTVVEREPKDGQKGVHWRENLVEFSNTTATADIEGAAIEAPPSKISLVEGKMKDKKPATPRLRRLKGLGAANGTPAKKLLASTLLPDEIEEEAAAAAAAAEAASRVEQSAIPTPSEVTDTALKRKSKLPPPKKLMLNPSVASLSALPVLAGKENVSQLISPAKKLGVGKGKIPIPTSNAMFAGAVTGTGDVVGGAKPIKRVTAGRKV